MIYERTCEAVFLARPNRFIAHVLLNGQEETVHVKNTGRCKELLVPGARVILQISDNPKRKTKYDLISVLKPSLGWVNVDSQVPNAVAREWLETQDFDLIRPEYTYGASRLDFYMEKSGEKYLAEVKGCTLEIEHKGYFPDAVSERAHRHCRELAAAEALGYHTMIIFVIAMPGVQQVYPNTDRDPGFTKAFEEALAAGTKVIHLSCHVTPDSITPSTWKVQTGTEG